MYSYGPAGTLSVLQVLYYRYSICTTDTGTLLQVQYLYYNAQVKLCDSTVRLEHLPGLEQRGIALELQVTLA